MKKWIWGVLILALVLRVIGLNTFPFGFTPDEASFGYDAYSLLKTGRDQWGHLLPLVLESFGDYKPPLFAYILMPFVGAFGLEKWVVRLPNALFGVGAVWITYLLVRELFPKKKIGKLSVATLSALLLAVSPWHIMMSRGGFEANLTTLLLPLGVLFFFKSFRKHNLLVWSSIVFGLNLFSYHSARLVTPGVVFFAIVFFWNDIKKIGKNTKMLSGGIFALFLILAAYSFFLGAGTRAADISIFSGALDAAAYERIIAINSGLNPTLARLIHNKWLVTLEHFFSNYLSYFSPRFLFTKGPAETTYGMIPGRGVIYWFELLFVGGLVHLLAVRKWKLSDPFNLVLAWLLLAPVPAALATGPGFAGNRSVVVLPALTILMALGAWSLCKCLQRSFGDFSKVMVTAIIIFSLGSFGNFLEDYFLLSPTKSAPGMLYGRMEVVSWLAEQDYGQREVIVSRRLSEPHIYVAFSEEFDPKVYQRTTTSWDYAQRSLGWVDQIPHYTLGNYTFKNIDWTAEKNNGEVLVGLPEEFPLDVEVTRIFTRPDGEAAVYVIDTLTGIADAN